MNKKTIIASLSDIANQLDNTGLYNEANSLTKVMSKIAMEKELDFPDEMPMFDEEKELRIPKKDFDFESDDLFEDKDYFGPTKCPECDSDNVIIDDQGNAVFCDNCGWDHMDDSNDVDDEEEDF